MSAISAEFADNLKLKIAELKKREAREKQSRRGGLIEFVRYFWHVLEPSTPMVDGWAMEAICTHLESVTFGECTRLLITVPPGFCKSLLTDVFFPAFEWGPMGLSHMRYVAFSYSASLTERDNGKFRDLILSQEYQELWGDQFGVIKVGETKISNTKTGWKLASSVGGVGTGERGNRVICLPYEEMVLTSDGWLPIGDVVEKRLPVTVAGLNDSGAVEWQPIESYEKNPCGEIVEIQWDGGSLRCTADHRIFIEGRGYVEAQDVKEKEVAWAVNEHALPLVREDDSSQTEHPAKILQQAMSLCCREEGLSGREQPTVQAVREDGLSAASALRENAERIVLQSSVPRTGQSRSQQSSLSGRRNRGVVPGMWREILRDKFTQGYCDSLLPILCFVARVEEGWQKGRAYFLQRVRDNLQAISSEKAVLLASVCGHGTFQARCRGRQWEVCSWASVPEISPWMVQETQGCNPRSGWKLLQGMWSAARSWHSSSPCSSYRLREGKSGPIKFDNGVQVLPRDDARETGTASGVERKTIRSVRKVGREDVTYNVRVSPCHNYFAGGILVHNCDDPHSIKQAESELIRSETTRWFREAMSNRLNDMAADVIIVIMQRTHDEDVAGIIVNPDNGFDYCVLSIEMELDTSRETFGTPNEIGWIDPRTIDEDGNTVNPNQCEGALAWPERFPRSVCEQTKLVIGPFAWASQYQQSPTPRSGGILKRLWWALWDGSEAQKYGLEWNEKRGGLKEFPHFELIVGSLDTAYGAKQENDFTAMTIFGVWQDQAKNRRAMLMYAWAKRLPLHGLSVDAYPGEAKVNYDARKKDAWGIVEWVADTCRRYKVQRLLIEDKTKGRDVSDELRRLYARENWGVEMITPTTDKVSRAHSVVPLLADGSVWAPQTNWSEMVLDQCARFPKAKNDDLCFVAGTLISTKRGDVPIETVAIGDEVITPIGWRPVIASGFTGVREVKKRRGLTGTPNHPVFILDKGFSPLDTVTQSSQITGLSLCSLIKTMHQRQLNLMGFLTRGWAASEDTIYRSQLRMPEDAEPRGFISRYGNSILARLFHLSTKFITKTLTPLTSALKIWSAYRLACTVACLRTLIGMLSDGTLSAFDPLPLNGIGQMKVENGIDVYQGSYSVQFDTYPEKLKAQGSVFGAARSFSTRVIESLSAATSAVVRKANSQEEKSAPATPIMRPVFNVTVDDAHCYYANGVLVHNCDTVTQFLNWARANEILVRGDEMSAAMEDEMSNFRRQESVAESYGVLH